MQTKNNYIKGKKNQEKFSHEEIKNYITRLKEEIIGKFFHATLFYFINWFLIAMFIE